MQEKTYKKNLGDLLESVFVSDQDKCDSILKQLGDQASKAITGTLINNEGEKFNPLFCAVIYDNEVIINLFASYFPSVDSWHAALVKSNPINIAGIKANVSAFALACHWERPKVLEYLITHLPEDLVYTKLIQTEGVNISDYEIFPVKRTIPVDFVELDSGKIGFQAEFDPRKTTESLFSVLLFSGCNISLGILINKFSDNLFSNIFSTNFAERLSLHSLYKTPLFFSLCSFYTDDLSTYSLLNNIQKIRDLTEQKRLNRTDFDLARLDCIKSLVNCMSNDEINTLIKCEIDTRNIFKGGFCLENILQYLSIVGEKDILEILLARMSKKQIFENIYEVSGAVFRSPFSLACSNLYPGVVNLFINAYIEKSPQKKKAREKVKKYLTKPKADTEGAKLNLIFNSNVTAHLHILLKEYYFKKSANLNQLSIENPILNYSSCYTLAAMGHSGMEHRLLLRTFPIEQKDLMLSYLDSKSLVSCISGVYDSYDDMLKDIRELADKRKRYVKPNCFYEACKSGNLATVIDTLKSLSLFEAKREVEFIKFDLGSGVGFNALTTAIKHEQLEVLDFFINLYEIGQERVELIAGGPSNLHRNINNCCQLNLLQYAIGVNKFAVFEYLSTKLVESIRFIVRNNVTDSSWSELVPLTDNSLRGINKAIASHELVKIVFESKVPLDGFINFAHYLIHKACNESLEYFVNKLGIDYIKSIFNQVYSNADQVKELMEYLIIRKLNKHKFAEIYLPTTEKLIVLLKTESEKMFIKILDWTMYGDDIENIVCSTKSSDKVSILQRLATSSHTSINTAILACMPDSAEKIITESSYHSSFGKISLFELSILSKNIHAFSSYLEYIAEPMILKLLARKNSLNLVQAEEYRDENIFKSVKNTVFQQLPLEFYEKIKAKISPENQLKLAQVNSVATTSQTSTLDKAESQRIVKSDKNFKKLHKHLNQSAKCSIFRNSWERRKNVFSLRAITEPELEILNSDELERIVNREYINFTLVLEQNKLIIKLNDIIENFSELGDLLSYLNSFQQEELSAPQPVVTHSIAPVIIDKTKELKDLKILLLSKYDAINKSLDTLNQKTRNANLCLAKALHKGLYIEKRTSEQVDEVAGETRILLQRFREAFKPLIYMEEIDANVLNSIKKCVKGFQNEYSHIEIKSNNILAKFENELHAAEAAQQQRHELEVENARRQQERKNRKKHQAQLAKRKVSPPKVSEPVHKPKPKKLSPRKTVTLCELNENLEKIKNHNLTAIAKQSCDLLADFMLRFDNNEISLDDINEVEHNEYRYGLLYNILRMMHSLGMLVKYCDVKGWINPDEAINIRDNIMHKFLVLPDTAEILDWLEKNINDFKRATKNLQKFGKFNNQPGRRMDLSSTPLSGKFKVTKQSKEKQLISLLKYFSDLEHLNKLRSHCVREAYVKWEQNGLLQSSIKGLFMVIGQSLRYLAGKYSKPSSEWELIMQQLSKNERVNSFGILAKHDFKDYQKTLTIYEIARIKIGHMYIEDDERWRSSDEYKYYIPEEISLMQLSETMKCTTTCKQIIECCLTKLYAETDSSVEIPGSSETYVLSTTSQDNQASISTTSLMYDAAEFVPSTSTEYNISSDNRIRYDQIYILQQAIYALRAQVMYCRESILKSFWEPSSQNYITVCDNPALDQLFIKVISRIDELRDITEDNTELLLALQERFTRYYSEFTRIYVFDNPLLLASRKVVESINMVLGDEQAETIQLAAFQ